MLFGSVLILSHTLSNPPPQTTTTAMGKKSAPRPSPPSAANRSKPVRTEDRVGGGGHLSIKVKDLKRQINTFAEGGEGVAIFESSLLQAVTERWLNAAAEQSEDVGHIKAEAALVCAARSDELLRCLLGEIAGVTQAVPGDDEVVTAHAESIAAKRAAKAETGDGAASAPSAMDEDEDDA